jgi:predicted permease
MESLLRDVRLAARSLGRNPGFTAVAVLTLALGIGATTTVFAVVYGVLMRPLPFPNAGRLVQIVQHLESKGEPEVHRAGLTFDQLANLQQHGTTLEATGILNASWRTLTGLQEPVRLSGASVSLGLLEGLGVSPIAGRLFLSGDVAAGAEPVVVLSHRTWRAYLGGGDVLERRIVLDGVPTRVVGVMPDGFAFPPLATFTERDSMGGLSEAPEFWIPLRPITSSGATGDGFTLVQSFALVRAGITIDRAQAEVRSIAGPLPDGRRLPLELVSARDEAALPARRALLTFQLGVLLVLAIALVNVVNLLLVRASGRRHETALRMAIGASRARIAREQIVETLLLTLGGGLLGCGLAYGLSGAFQRLPPHMLPRLREVRVDAVVLLGALALSLAAGLGVGLLAALRAGWRTPFDYLHYRGAPGAPAGRMLSPSHVLVVLEIGAATVLLTASVLLVNSFIRLVRVDLGYQPEGVVTFQLRLQGDRYAEAAARTGFYNALATELEGRPGVVSVAGTSIETIGFYPLFVDGQERDSRPVRYRLVTPGYFGTLRLPVRQGREFLRADADGRTRNVIVNEAFARRYLSGGPAIGHVIRWADWFGTRDIVGVVADSRETHDAPEDPAMYVAPDSDAGIGSLTMLVRAPGQGAAAVAAARQIARQIDPTLAVHNVTTLEDKLSLAMATPRFYGQLSLAWAIVALLLAAIGLYGVLAYSVRARWHELGVRLALGATARRVMAGVIGQGFALAGAGVALGLAGSYLTVGALSALLFGVDPHDAPTFLAVMVACMASAALACLVPAWRAMRVDPVEVLRAH